MSRRLRIRTPHEAGCKKAGRWFVWSLWQDDPKDDCECVHLVCPKAVSYGPMGRTWDRNVCPGEAFLPEGAEVAL